MTRRRQNYPLSRGHTELQLNVDLPRDVAETLDAVCERENIKKKQFVEAAIRVYFRQLGVKIGAAR